MGRSQSGDPSGNPAAGRDAEVRAAVVEAMRGVIDPCCRERGISVIDMGLLRGVHVGDSGDVTIEILLTSGWCPFQLDLVEEIGRAVEDLAEVAEAEVSISLEEVWSTDRLSEGARRKLTLLPEPAAVADRDAFIATAGARPATVPLSPGTATSAEETVT